MADAGRVGCTLELSIGVMRDAIHAIDVFVADRSFLIIIGPMFLTIALLCAAGTAALDRTASIARALLAAFRVRLSEHKS